MLSSKYYLYNTVSSFLTNLGLTRKATYVWSYDEFMTNKHLIKGKSGSYGIYNSLNSKLYIGSALDLGARLMHHLEYATPRNSNIRLQHSLKKYGLVNFQIIIFDILPTLSINPRQDVVDFENALFQAIPCKDKLYNFTYVADSSIGYKHTDAAKQLMSVQLSGSKNVAPKSFTLIDMANNITYELGTIKDAASIIGVSRDNVYQISKNNPPIYLNRWLFIRHK